MLPKIKKVEFRDVQIGEELFKDNDLLIHRNGVEALAATHRVSEKDFEKMLLHEPEIAIFGTGFKKAIAIDQGVLDAARRNNVELVILPTEQASKKFQELARSGKNVVAKLHITC
jgi:hypothetical protein